MVSGWHLFIVLIALSSIYPAGVVLKRLGYSPFWGVLVFVPVVNFIALWVLGLSLGDPPDKPKSSDEPRRMTFD